jgi:hypothetical protein
MLSNVKVGDPIYVRDLRLNRVDPDWTQLTELQVIKVGRVWVTIGVKERGWTYKQIRKDNGVFQDSTDQVTLVAFASKLDLADYQWLSLHHRDLILSVERCRDVTTLRKIHELLQK